MASITRFCATSPLRRQPSYVSYQLVPLINAKGFPCRGVRLVSGINLVLGLPNMRETTDSGTKSKTESLSSVLTKALKILEPLRTVPRFYEELELLLMESASARLRIGVVGVTSSGKSTTGLFFFRRYAGYIQRRFVMLSPRRNFEP